MGYLVAQQLVAARERMLDVLATLASRVRVLGSGFARCSPCRCCPSRPRRTLGRAWFELNYLGHTNRLGDSGWISARVKRRSGAEPAYWGDLRAWLGDAIDQRAALCEASFGEAM